MKKIEMFFILISDHSDSKAKSETHHEQKNDDDNNEKTERNRREYVYEVREMCERTEGIYRVDF